MVGKAMEDSYSSREAIRCIHIGLLCVQDLAIDRPTMPDVVFLLSNETNRPQPKQPLFTFQISPKCKFQLQNESICSVNEATMNQMGAEDRDWNALLSMFIIFCLFPSQYCFATHNITWLQPLSQGQTLISPGQVFELGFFIPNNSRDQQYVGIWYKGISSRRVVWVANRENPLRVADSGASLKISSNGNMELVDGNHNSVWSTNINVSSNSSVATLSDTGNFVINDGESGESLWQSFDHPGDTCLSSSVLGFNIKTGQNYVLTSWRSESDPSLGDFTFEVSSKLWPPQVLICNGSSPHWRSGPWDGLKFIGLPEMDESYQRSFDLVEDVNEGTTYLTFNVNNKSIEEILLMSSEGFAKLLSRDKSNDWYTKKELPKSPCDFYGTCGPFGVCKASESPICRCLEGFSPKSDQEWTKGNWTQGCLRETTLLCEKNDTTPSTEGGNKDGFLKIGNMKLPDFYQYVNKPEDRETCGTWCLDNCSCLAYSYENRIGCLIWSDDLVDIQEFPIGGEDLFLRLAHSELVEQRKSKTITIILATISSVATLGAILLIGMHRWRANQKRNSREAREKLHFIEQFAEQYELPIFDLSSILLATDNFSIQNKLGQGGFGPVYKGKLQDGKEIAVKRLSSNSGQGMEEFMNEMKLISKLQHRNLVRLVGFCVENEEKLIMYEYMPNKSLDNFIFDTTRKAQLNWATRFNIIQGIAKGLVYLHRDSCLRVIHRDLKVSNILLDEKMNPKISDFGLARIFQGTIDLANTRRIVGTLGYMSLEYAMGGIFSEKSDVFSFGVLILEIVSGRKNTSFHCYDQQPSLIAYAWDLWSESRGLDMVDKALEDSCSSTEAIRCIHIGLLCVQDHAIDRPTMPDVALMLSNETDRPQPKQPLFTFKSSTEGSFQLQNDSKFSANEATMSIVYGR